MEVGSQVKTFTLGVDHNADVHIPFNNFEDEDLSFDFPKHALDFDFDEKLGWRMKKADNDDVDDIEYYVDIRSS